MSELDTGPTDEQAEHPDGVRLHVLGPLQATAPGGVRLELGGPRPRRVLAALAIDAGRAVPIDRLAERVWGQRLPDDPRAALHTLVARLRSVLGARSILTESGGYRLAAGAAGVRSPVSLDALTFTCLVADAEAPTSSTLDRVGLLDEALALWAGPAYDEVAGEEWARVEVERLEELRIVATERRFEATLAAGKHTDALPALAAATEQHPLRERLVGQHMLALFRSGRQAEATRVFQAHRRRLADDIGLDPGRELVELDRRIVADDAGLHLDTAASVPGRALRGYRLGEQLGEGAFAVVFRGTQPSLGRDVAVKVIRSELANRPEFIRRFEAEAHFVAALEHPHVVPLYDYWREPDRAYLVFRYLRGGTLEGRLTTGRGLAVGECRTLATQVGSALAAAHRAGVVHRDVKPANVFLDETVNFYLGDFGIALDGADLHDPAAALSAGSPAYAAPEQLRRERVGPQADVHGLGITLYEALTGRLPFPDAVSHADLLQHQLHRPIPAVRAQRVDLPPAVDDVLAVATAKRPQDRYDTVEAFTAAFLDALDGPGEAPATRRRAVVTAMSTGADRNPYKGLHAFAEADAADFKGRARLVDRLVAGLSRTDTTGRVAMVVGPSGIGKSSVVRAGLLPALRRGAVPGSERWFIASMLPGTEPFEELAAALLRIASVAPENLMGELQEDKRGLARVVKTLIPPGSDSSVLLVIDQFEELFTLGGSDVTRRRFLDAIEYALTDARCPLRVVATMRADFYDRPLRHGSFARLIEPSTVAVTALAPDELEAAIVEPAIAVGCEFEPGLVSEIVADVSDQPGALPLLQYALTELWERHISGLLTRDAYRASGGVTGALAATAERLHDASPPEERQALRRLFGRLVTLGEGVEDTRRRVLRSELGMDASIEGVLQRFGAGRLLSFDRDPVSREPTVEVAHEALLREWPRLRGWLEEDRDGLRVLRHLTASATAWTQRGMDPGELYRGGRLDTAEAWSAGHAAELNEAEAAYLTASIERREKDRLADARQLRRLRGALAGIGVVAVLALVAGAVAVVQQRRADGQAVRAQQQAELAATAASESETRRLVSDAGALSAENRDVALLLASEAYRRAPGPQTLAGLQRVLTATGPYLGTIGAGGYYLAAGELTDGTIVGVRRDAVAFFDGATWQPTGEIPLPAAVKEINAALPVAIRGTTVAVGTEAGTVLLVEDRRPRVLAASPVAIRSVVLDDDVLVVGDTGGEVRLVDLRTGLARWTTQVLPERTYRQEMGDVRWSAMSPGLISFLESFEPSVFGAGPVGVEIAADRSIVVNAGPFLRRLDRASGSLTQQLYLERPGNAPPVSSARFTQTPAGGYKVTSANTVVEIDATLTTVTIGAIPTGRFDLNVVSRAMVTDATGRSWFGLNNGQLASGIVANPVDNGENPSTGLADIRSLSLAPQGGIMLIAGDGGIVAWSVDGRQLLAGAAPRNGNSGGTVSSDGTRLTTSTLSGATARSRLYDIGRGAARELDTATWRTGVDYSYYGDRSDRWITEFDNGTMRLLDATTFAPVATIEDVSFSILSADGGRLVAAQWRGTGVRVYDTTSWQQVSPLLDLSAWQTTPGNPVPAFDASGDRIFVSIQDTGTTVVYDTETWQVLRVIEANDHGGVIAARFSRDGTVLVTLGIDGTIALRDPQSWAVRQILALGVNASDNLDLGLYLSDDGHYLLTTRDRRPRLWHLPTVTMIGAFPHRGGLGATGTDLGDVLRLVTMDADNVLIWNLDVTTWPAIACRAAGRNLTGEEWAQFGPKDTPYHATCAQWGPAA